MALLQQVLRVPRPESFLYLMSLRTGTELIALTMIFNKLTGFYGFIAVLTGFRLNATQLSMYIYSVAALALLAFLTPHIRRQDPLRCLGLAWFYMIDTVVNCAYTALFAVTWFLTISASQGDKSGSVEAAPGAGTINDTAGFTSPEFPSVSSVVVIATPTAAAMAGEGAAVGGISGPSPTVTGSPTIVHGVGLAESVPSIVVIVVLTLIRVYFVLIVMAYARQVLRQHMVAASSAKAQLHVDGAHDDAVDDPFSPETPQGRGWQGRLGRSMISIGKGYWIGHRGDDEWKTIAKKFKGPRPTTPRHSRNTSDHERHARSRSSPTAAAHEGVLGVR